MVTNLALWTCLVRRTVGPSEPGATRSLRVRVRIRIKRTVDRSRNNGPHLEGYMPKAEPAVYESSKNFLEIMGTSPDTRNRLVSVKRKYSGRSRCIGESIRGGHLTFCVSLCRFLYVHCLHQYHSCALDSGVGQNAIRHDRAARSLLPALMSRPPVATYV